MQLSIDILRIMERNDILEGLLRSEDQDTIILSAEAIISIPSGKAIINKNIKILKTLLSKLEEAVNNSKKKLSQVHSNGDREWQEILAKNDPLMYKDARYKEECRGYHQDEIKSRYEYYKKEITTNQELIKRINQIVDGVKMDNAASKSNRYGEKY